MDSLSFRNKQLEIRVASLQDDLSRDSSRTRRITNPKTTMSGNESVTGHHEDALLFNKDLQKKIMENVRLESLVADKAAELQVQASRIEELEARIAETTAEQAENDNRLRGEIERLHAKNHDLEARLEEARSIIGSDDTLYVASECDQYTVPHISSNNSKTSDEERLKAMEKENVYWRTQFEILKIGHDVQFQHKAVDSDSHVGKTSEEPNNSSDIYVNLLYKHFTAKIEDLFSQKCTADANLMIYIEEVRKTDVFSDVLEQKEIDIFHQISAAKLL